MGRQYFSGLDLFGNPVPRVRDKAGRPEHEWTVENSNKINVVFLIGGSPKDAALVVGVSMPTFRKVYFSEHAQWKGARLRAKTAVIGKLFEEARGGNVSAAKAVLKEIEKGALVQLAERVANRPPAEPKAAAKGKKQLQTEAAGRVGGKFAPPEAPQLVH